VILRVMLPHPYQPLYVVTLNKEKPQVQLQRIAGTDCHSPPPQSGQQPTVPLGSWTSHHMVLKTDVVIAGHSFTMKRNHTTWARHEYVFECPNNLGKLEWKAAGKKGGDTGLLELHDENNTSIARFTTKLPAGRLLEILVPCDLFLQDIIVITAIAASRILEKDLRDEKLGEDLADAFTEGLGD
jgi:hypothetical protein